MTRAARMAAALFGIVIVGSASALPPPLPTPGTTRTSTRPSKDQAEYALKFTETEIDFGQVDDEGRVEIEFPFVIQGGEPIRIKRLNPSCGCTTAELEKNVYEPGEWGVIKATFNPERRQGMQHKSITVYSTDPNYGTQRLTVKGYVRPIAYAEPSIVNLGRLEKGASSTRTFKVLGRKEGFEVTGLKVTDPELMEAEILGGKDVEIDGHTLREYEIRVRMKGRRMAGQFSANIEVETNDERRPMLSVQAAGIVNSELAFDMPMVRVNKIPVGEVIEQELILRHTEMREFKIVSAEHTGKAFDVEMDWEPVDEGVGAYRIMVRATAVLESRGFRDRIVITTDMDDEAPVEAYFTGTTVAAEDGGIDSSPRAGGAP